MRTKARVAILLVGAILCVNWLVTVQAGEMSHKATFLVIYRPGPAWVAGKPVSQQDLGAHFQYMLDLYEQGLLKHAGPFSDDSGGAVVLEVADEAQAKTVAAADPAVRSNIMIAELRPWSPLPWEQYLQKRKAKQAGQ